jgi:co-chaperonin GroES (HSP10)
VLIKPKEKEEKSAGGVILAGGSGSGMGDGVLTGTVVSVGEDVDVGVTAGDYVLFTKYGSSDIETDEGSVSFVAQKSILAKLS